MHLGEVIKKYRTNHVMSMQAFADKCNLSKGYIAMLEHNKNSKTGDPVVPSIETFIKVADAMNISLDILSEMVDENQPIAFDNREFVSSAKSTSVRIPVLGTIPAGIPIEAIENIDDWEEIPKEWTVGGKEYFGLKIEGDSMSPKYLEGDTVIFRKADDCESGDECAVYVNGYDATFKKVVKKTNHIILQPLNPVYEPMMFDYDDPKHPIKIAGIAVELRRKL